MTLLTGWEMVRIVLGQRPGGCSLKKKTETIVTLPIIEAIEPIETIKELKELRKNAHTKQCQASTFNPLSQHTSMPWMQTDKLTPGAAASKLKNSAGSKHFLGLVRTSTILHPRNTPLGPGACDP